MSVSRPEGFFARLRSLVSGLANRTQPFFLQIVHRGAPLEVTVPCYPPAPEGSRTTGLNTADTHPSSHTPTLVCTH